MTNTPNTSRTMSNEYRAVPALWDAAERFGRNTMDMVNCLLELRARVEALEATQHAHVNLSGLPKAERQQLVKSLGQPASVQPLEPNAKPTPNDRQIRSSLVERVASAIGWFDENVNWKPEARAAIREVIAYLQENYTDTDWVTAAAVASVIADLKEEAER